MSPTRLVQLRALVVKELRQTVRDRRMMALLVAAPVIQLVVLGFAVDLEVDDVPTVVVDHDHSRLARDHLTSVLADGTLVGTGASASVAAAEREMNRGRAAVILVVPPGYEEDLVRGRQATLQAIVDGSDPNRSTVAGNAVLGFARSRALERLAAVEAAQAAAGAPTMADVRMQPRVYFNPELDTAIYMVPGVAGILLMLVTTVIAAMGLARERERGTLEQVLVTPLPSWVLIAGKVIPFAGIGLIDFALALVVGAYVFDMPLRGSFLVLFGATGLYLLTTLGVGLFVSTVSDTQQQAFLGGFFFILPAALLSGILTPIGSMPAWMQPMTLANPLRHYAVVLRGSLLRGADAVDLAPALVALAAFGAVTFTASVLRFRKTNR
ncbi:MAG: ABC transporter permease [Sandaracinaceae bacterium]